MIQTNFYGQTNDPRFLIAANWMSELSDALIIPLAIATLLLVSRISAAQASHPQKILRQETDPVVSEPVSVSIKKTNKTTITLIVAVVAIAWVAFTLLFTMFVIDPLMHLPPPGKTVTLPPFRSSQ